MWRRAVLEAAARRCAKLIRRFGRNAGDGSAKARKRRSRKPKAASAAAGNDDAAASAPTADAAVAATAPAADAADAPTDGGGAPPAPADREKRLSALRKKLRQIEELKVKRQSGVTLDPGQITKMQNEAQILREIAQLTL